ncbi:uncharacterized protein [Typha angustifolia]|uniref:uncharacterized protein n=1 Tax=Typha angustifolia TaxID=59011 RepID=UPI003C2CF349
MDCNMDEAIRAREMAERKFSAKDIKGAKKFALKAQNLFPSLEGIAQMIATLDVYLAAEGKINGESDWYGVLCLNASADEETVKKQYRKLALQLHPDKNKSIGAEGAFKLISEAWSVLSDKSRKTLYDQKRNIKGCSDVGSQQNSDHAVSSAANGFYTPSNKRTSNTRARKSNSRAAQSASAPSSQHSRLDTFWTSCNRCRMQYEYLRVYLNHNLLCPNCHQAFLAVEIGFPSNGTNSSFSWSSKQHNQNVNHSSTKHHSYGSGSRTSSIPGTGHAGYQAEGNFDSYNNSNYQWGQYSKATGATCTNACASQTANVVHHTSEKRRRKHEAQTTTFETNNHVPSYNASANPYGQERPTSRVGRPAKRNKRNINGDTYAGYGGDDMEKWAAGTGKAVGLETQRSNGSEDNTKARVTAKQNTFKEYSQVDMRNMLIEKAKMAIHKKLEEWNVAAAAGSADKEKLKQRRNQKDTYNERVGSGLGRAPVKQNQLDDSRINNNQASVVKDPANDSKVKEPVSIDVPDPDFHDFDKYRTERAFESDQVWASYDNEDGMPRLYAMVQKVISLKPFKIRMSFLSSKSNSEFGPLNWVNSGFSKTCGDFRVSRYEITDTINIFSHRVRWEKGPRGVIKIVPKKGDTWALYRNWSSDWNELTPDDVIHKYEMVEVLDDYDDEHGLTVAPLLKVAGFKTVFHRHMDPKEVKRIPREEMFRFSHQVPSHLLTGEEAHNAPRGCHELDPAATPVEFLQMCWRIPTFNIHWASRFVISFFFADDLDYNARINSWFTKI